LISLDKVKKILHALITIDFFKFWTNIFYAKQNYESLISEIFCTLRVQTLNKKEIAHMYAGECVCRGTIAQVYCRRKADSCWASFEVANKEL